MEELAAVTRWKTQPLVEFATDLKIAHGDATRNEGGRGVEFWGEDKGSINESNPSRNAKGIGKGGQRR